jgi:hypothetical protein
VKLIKWVSWLSLFSLVTLLAGCGRNVGQTGAQAPAEVPKLNPEDTAASGKGGASATMKAVPMPERPRVPG